MGHAPKDEVLEMNLHKRHTIALMHLLVVTCVSFAQAHGERTRIAALSFEPFNVETNLPITPSNIWFSDVSKQAVLSLGAIENILKSRDVSAADSLDFAKFNLSKVRVGIRWNDRTEEFIDSSGVVLFRNRVFRLPSAKLKQLKAVLKPAWNYENMKLPRRFWSKE
jgi:hypothetical protein